MVENNNNQNNWEMYQPDLTAEHLNHQRLLEPLISLYQDGEANEEEAATVEQYLLACAECRAINIGFQALDGTLADYFETIPAPRFDRRNYAFLDEGPALPATRRSAGISAVPGGALPDDRGKPGTSRRSGFAYNLAGGMAAALLIGLVAVLLLVVSQQVNQNKNDGTVTAQAMVAGQTQDANQTQTPQADTSPTPEVTTPPATQGQPTTTPATTGQPQTQAAGTPGNGTPATGPDTVVQATAAPPRTPVGPTQKPLPTATPVPVPTNTPNVGKTTAASVQPTATPTVMPTALPTTGVSTPPAATATPATPDETVAPTLEPTATAPATEAPPTLTPVPPTPGDTSAAAPGWIAYVDQSDGQIHLVKADGSSDQVISDPTVNRNLVYEELVWSNDGKLLVAVGRNNNTGSRSIFLLDIANPLRVEELAEGFAPNWSPDNLSIAFLAGPATVKNGALSGKPAIFSLRKRTVTNINTLADTFAPQWFADSTRLFIGQDRIYDSDSGTINTFKLPFINTCLAASLSPAGDKLANLELQADGSYQTVIYDLSKGQLDPKRPLAKASADFQGKIGLNCGSQRLNWTPDSRNIYYYVNNGANGATCLVQANGGGSRCLTNVYDPSFNSDGSALVDISPTSGGDGQVYTASADVSARPPRPRLIAESVVAPVWQPL
jgi:anti-sigma factor RsiW